MQSLLIYEILISHASVLEKKTSGIHQEMVQYSQFNNRLSFYSLISICPLPITSLTSILESPNISGHLLLRESKYPIVSSVSTDFKSGHCKATSPTKITETELNFHKIRGSLHLGRSGFGNVKGTPATKERSQAHCKLITKLQQQIGEEHNLERALKLKQQYHWVQ